MDADHRLARYIAFDPFRSADWRWQRAQCLLAHRRYSSKHGDDDLTVRAAHYLRLVQQSSGTVSRLYLPLLGHRRN